MKHASDATCPELFTMANLPDDQVALIDALLLSARYARADYEPATIKRSLDHLADQVRPRIDTASSLRDRISILTEFLFEECGFKGNSDEYYDPRNSYMSEVIARRQGIPITLAVVCIEVAARVGIVLDAISFPYHFLLSPAGIDNLFLDPFDGGQPLTTRDCRLMLERFSEGNVPFQTCYLEPASTRDVVLRVMRNLKMVHARQRQQLEAIACIDVMLAWKPDQPREVRDRGLLYAQLGVWGAAIRDLESYLSRCPSARDRLRIEIELTHARREQPPLD